jgi:hypothetical protein
MNSKNMTALTIAAILCILSGSTALAQRHGGGFGGGRGFGSSGFHGGGSRGASNGRGFGGRGFRGDRFHHRHFGDRFEFFGDFGDPFFYDSFYGYGYYPYGGYPYGYGYSSYDPDIYPGGGGYRGSLTEELQVRLALAGFYHGSIDGVNGSATRRAIRDYERVHGLPADGKVTGRLLTTMGVG